MKINCKNSGDLTPIRIVGIGGAGCHIVKHMMSELPDVEYIVMNDDLPSLNLNPCPKKLYLDLGGRGEGQPGLSRHAALLNSEKIEQALSGAKTVALAVGLGGNCGTESAPVVAQIAKDLGSHVVCVVTMPFSFEGKKRVGKAKDGLSELHSVAEHLIVLENDTLFQMFHKNMSVNECFARADETLCHRLRELFVLEGMV